MNYPKSVKIVEVGPRDGLQNEKKLLPTSLKIELIHRLADCGLTSIESSSFVSPKRIPQLADASRVMEAIVRKPGVIYSALVPNTRGMERALLSFVDEVAVFTAASETFNQKNTHCTIEESLDRIKDVISLAKSHQLKVRAYLSCVLGCPYEGCIDVDRVATIASKLLELGCYEISLADTIGVGTAEQARHMIKTVAKQIPISQTAIHFHDTYGQALANTLACLQEGVSVIDSSIAGLGGCPYAEGASGNLATEDLVYMLHGMKIKTGVNLPRLIETGQFISEQLNRVNASSVGLSTNANKPKRSPST